MSFAKKLYEQFNYELGSLNSQLASYHSGDEYPDYFEDQDYLALLTGDGTVLMGADPKAYPVLAEAAKAVVEVLDTKEPYYVVLCTRLLNELAMLEDNYSSAGSLSQAAYYTVMYHERPEPDTFKETPEWEALITICTYFRYNFNFY